MWILSRDEEEEVTIIQKREFKNINRQIELQKKKCKMLKGQLDENIEYLFELIEEKDNLANRIIDQDTRRKK